MPGLPVGPPMG